MGQEVFDLGPGPGLQGELWRKEAAHVGIEIFEPKVHHDKCEQKAGHRYANESHEREEVISKGVLLDGRVYANGKGKQPRQQNGRNREDHGESQTVANDVQHRQVILHGHAEVAVHYQAYPSEILHVDGFVQPILLPQHVSLFLPDDRARGGECSDVGRHKIAGGQLDDGEGEHAYGDDGQDRQDDAS